MNVLHDYQIFLRQKYGGISRYHVEVVKALKTANDMNARIFALFSDNYYLNQIQKQKIKINGGKYVRYSLMLANDFLTFIHIIVKSWTKSPYDIIHLTWYKAFYLTALKRIYRKKMPKIVITVHDLIHQIESERNPILRKGARDMSKMIKMADAVICVSEHTKMDLLRFYPETDVRKLYVVYHGINVGNKPDQKEVYSKWNNTILFVGKRTGYKNFITFLKAAAIAKQELGDLTIKCAGGDPFSQEEKDVIDSLGLQDCITQKNMSDNELEMCYKKVSCFVFPSLYEGFGIPILEAFVNGCPLVLSNKSCLPEIAGDAAVYFDGMDHVELAQKIVFFCSSEKEREIYIRKGYERVKEFSWDKTAKETLEVYNWCIESKMD